MASMEPTPEIIDDVLTDNAPPANTSVIIPKTRTEHFLAKIAGDPNAKELTPRTRREYFLNEIAENVGGSGGGSGGANITILDGRTTVTDNDGDTVKTISFKDIYLERPQEATLLGYYDNQADLGNPKLYVRAGFSDDIDVTETPAVRIVYAEPLNPDDYVDKFYVLTSKCVIVTLLADYTDHGSRDAGVFIPRNATFEKGKKETPPK